jgi:hypothetical protein
LSEALVRVWLRFESDEVTRGDHLPEQNVVNAFPANSL